MRSQPNRNYVSDDVVQTPAALARRLVEHFRPRGRVLEPCKGEGNVLRALRAYVRDRCRPARNRAAAAVAARVRPASSRRVLVGGPLESTTGAQAAVSMPSVNRAKERPDSHLPVSPSCDLPDSPPHRLPVFTVSPRRRLTASPSTVLWAEIKEGRDFYEWTTKVDWIITNPPWSQVRRFLRQAMLVADHVVFLLTVNHVWTKARVRDIRDAGFGVREIVLVDMPRTFPQSGFQLGAVHLERGWKGPMKLTDWTGGNRETVRR